MAYKNPFDHSSRGKAADGGTAGKPAVNPFDRSKSIGKSAKPAAKAPPRSIFANMKPGAKTGLEKMRELAEKRKTGMLKALPQKKLTLAAPPPPAPKTAFAAANGGGAAPAKAPETATPVPAAAARPNALGGAGPPGAQAGTPASSGTGSSGEAPRSGLGSSEAVGAKPAAASSKSTWIKNDPPPAAQAAPAKTGMALTQAQPNPVNVSMTSENYTRVYQEQTLGMKGAAAQPMTAENYMEVYKTQSMGLEGTGAQKMNSDNYTQVYKAQQGFTGLAAEEMTSENYTKVYQQQEAQREVQKAVVQIAKQQEAATIETRKAEQKNAQLAGQAQGLYAKLAHLRGALGKGPDEDAGTYAAIAEVEGALAQIPTGLR